MNAVMQERTMVGMEAAITYRPMVNETPRPEKTLAERVAISLSRRAAEQLADGEDWTEAELASAAAYRASLPMSGKELAAMTTQQFVAHCAAGALSYAITGGWDKVAWTKRSRRAR